MSGLDEHEQLDTSNDFFVGKTLATGDYVVMLPVHGPVTRERALRLAAWIVALDIEPDAAPTFAEILAAVCAT